MKTSVFLADDHAVLRDVVKMLIQASGAYEIAGEAANGHDAVRAMTELKPDLALIDISMPELNGIEATRRILDASPGTRVLILSMHATPEHVVRSLRAGASGYVLKDNAAAEVLDAMRAVLAGRRYLSRGIDDAAVDEQLRRP